MPTLQDSSRDFLSRARQCIAKAEEAPEMLLYAALELRLGIEARLHEYLDAAEKYAVLKKRGWKISKLSQDFERVFETGTQIASFEVLGEDKSSLKTLLFTPVTARAKQIAQRLGDYLHYSEGFRPKQEAWRNGLKSLVQEGIKELEISTTGTFLAPPMWNPATGEANIFMEVLPGESIESVKKMLGEIGKTITVKVNYHDSLPIRLADRTFLADLTPPL